MLEYLIVCMYVRMCHIVQLYSFQLKTINLGRTCDLKGLEALGKNLHTTLQCRGCEFVYDY